ncbi:hypothetical protein [Sulfobacillus thermosulfidooxidans]|uniref:hypothetical protein n=1 Tax=Sulfobacillus thermosulfidooxidans TaxID=28034 RepID=UPI00048F25F5|nr:hypothetical protein [Sulfobacillus thermosulfidooxidans]
MQGSYRSVLLSIGLSLGVVGLLAGCGQQSAAPSSSTFGGASAQKTTSPSPSSRNTAPTSATPTSSKPSQASDNMTMTIPSTPAPPQAGVYSEMTIAVTHVIAEGHETVNGQSMNVYALTVTIHNPTSALIPLALNDFSVEPLHASAYTYSYNDVMHAPLTASSSLFPLPVDSSSPSSVVRYIQPGSAVSGTITVMVAPSSAYQIVWGGTTKVATTFAVS